MVNDEWRIEATKLLKILKQLSTQRIGVAARLEIGAHAEFAGEKRASDQPRCGDLVTIEHLALEARAVTERRPQHLHVEARRHVLRFRIEEKSLLTGDTLAASEAPGIIIDARRLVGEHEFHGDECGFIQLIAAKFVVRTNEGIVIAGFQQAQPVKKLVIVALAHHSTPAPGFQ